MLVLTFRGPVRSLTGTSEIDDLSSNQPQRSGVPGEPKTGSSLNRKDDLEPKTRKGFDSLVQHRSARCEVSKDGKSRSVDLISRVYS